MNQGRQKISSAANLKKMRKSLQAHQQAPIDYISPWQAQHYHVFQSHANQNSKLKNKIPEYKQNVVQAFLEKITKNNPSLVKNGMIKSLDAQPEDYRRNFFSPGQTNLAHNKLERERRSYTQEQGMKLMPKQSLEGAQDVGFGLVKYNKYGVKKQNKERDQIAEQKSPISQTLFNFRQSRKALKQAKLRATAYTSPNEFEKWHEDENVNLTPMQMNRTKTQLKQARNLKRRAVTEEQKPQNIVFVKKKKPHNKITVVDINETAQEFYEEEMKYIEKSMLKKYGKSACRKSHLLSRSQNTRYPSQFQNQILKMSGNNEQNFLITQQPGHVSYKFSCMKDRETRKRRATFIDSLKDRGILSKVNNIMRNHPSLAITLFFNK